MNSSLLLSLAITGGLVLAAIVAYNTWTLRRNEPKKAQPPDPSAPSAPSAFGAAGMDPLLDPILRQEPSLDGDLAGAAGASPLEGLDRGQDPHDHAIDPTDALRMPAPAHLVERRPGLDPLIDVIATLSMEGVVSGDAALAAFPPTRRAGSKPFAIEGLNDATQVWETPVPGQRYRSFQAGVQLANRMGALNEIEFSEFVMKTQAFADAINAAPDFPDMLQEVARARELDQFAGDHDAQLLFVLRARQAAWSPGYLLQNAARVGFVAGSMPGRLVLPASTPGMPPVLTLGYDTQAALADDPEQSAIRDISLSLDVPQVHRSEQAFARLRDVGAALAEAMDGVLCDQNGQPLPAMAMDPIAADLELLYDQLEARDLSAGSVLARRLFS